MTDREATPAVEGFFEGKYYDILGHRGEIRFTLQGSQIGRNGHDLSQYDGTCELLLTDADEPLVFRGTAQILLGNFSSGQEQNSRGEIRMSFIENRNDPSDPEIASPQSPPWTAAISMSIQAASPFAKQVIYGTLGAPTDEPGLGGGVWIAWHFAEAK